MQTQFKLVPDTLAYLKMVSQHLLGDTSEEASYGVSKEYITHRMIKDLKGKDIDWLKVMEYELKGATIDGNVKSLQTRLSLTDKTLVELEGFRVDMLKVISGNVYRPFTLKLMLKAWLIMEKYGDMDGIKKV